MSIALKRLFEGIVSTLRTDIIPHVGDSYARGQAVGIIDLINNVATRIEWARAPLIESVREKRRLLTAVARTLGGTPDEAITAPELMGSAELAEERTRLDAAICAAMQAAHARADEAGRDALGLLIRHAHDEASLEMKLTRKPLFAEIASGKNEQRPPA